MVALHPDGIRSVNSGFWRTFNPAATIPEEMDRDSSVLKVRAEVDGCLPLHLLLDCAHPNYALAEHMLALYPEAAEVSNNDGLLTAHALLRALRKVYLQFWIIG